MKAILKYLNPFAKSVTWNLGLKVLATVIELALPRILSFIINDIIKPLDGMTDIDIRARITEIVIWAVVMIACAALAFIGNVTANRHSARIAKDVAGSIRRDLFDRTMTLSPAQTDEFTVPSLESRLTSDTYNIHNFINSMQRMGVRAPIMLVGGLAICATMDLRLTLVMACILPMLFIAVYTITKQGLPLYTKVQKAVDGMIRVVREDAQGIRVIKALSRKKYEYERYERENGSLARIEGRTNSIMAASNPVMNFFMNLGLVSVVFVGAHLIDGGKSEVGNIIAFIQYFTLISGAMMGISRIFVMTSKATASARRISEVLAAGEGLPTADESEYPGKNESGIRFDHVSFAYSGTKEILHDIDFSLEKGQKLGIIGATGSGKTTVISLLMRFYDVSSGSVRINGRDVRTMPESELHSLFGVAMQNDFIVTGTVEENIRFYRDISSDDVRKAAVIAQADEFISAFPEGYDYELAAKGTNLSGGQKQRILIARALAGMPEILILDDSSSALDYRTDMLLRQAISEMQSGITSVIVAQRVSSVMNSDLILVLDEGRIIGAGTHEELMRDCEVYREISNSQMGGAFLE
ncbi:MAG: ABC transporter ATP-binding protein/permease [Clostridia bacterium]|nr:ABC transporter ATP-binding protein/permease [Clostridia bacterium]